MGIGAGIFLIAIGAILKFAVTTETVYGVNLQVVGIILCGRCYRRGPAPVARGPGPSGIASP